MSQYEYYAQIVSVIDGDTLELKIDLGFRQYTRKRIRLDEINTAEIFGTPKDSDEYQKGMEQKKMVESWIDAVKEFDFEYEIADGYPFIFVSHGESGMYGRWIGDLKSRMSVEEQNESLIDEIKKQYPEAKYE